MTIHIAAAASRDIIFHVPNRTAGPIFGFGIAQFALCIQVCVPLVQESPHDHWLAVGSATRSTSVGAANLATSMQYAVCAAVLDTELDDVAAVCLRQHLIRLLQAFASTIRMQSKYAVSVLASKCHDRTCQHDSKLTADFQWTCNRHRFCVHVHNLLYCLPTSQQQGTYQHNKYMC